MRVQTYRAYIRLDEPPDAEAVGRLEAMHASALQARPDLATPLGVLRALLLDSSTSSEAGRDLVIRFQQVCGPVMAKGVEDTTFYRFNEMLALNEVGGDPGALAEPSVDALHAWADRQSLRWPAGMTTLSTHDTKRGEDVRAVLFAAAEDVDGWRGVWGLVRAAATGLRVDEPTAYLVTQTLVGTWPIGLDRLDAYLEKAVREAKQHTAWTDGDEDYERRVHDLAAHCLAEGDVSAAIGSWVHLLQPSTRAVVLASKLLQLMLPGVPDVYQGCETVVRSLVDPDNRRPVDYADRRSRLEHLDSGGELRDVDDEKLWVTSRALRLRRDRPELVGAKSTYRALPATSHHVIGFVRSEQVAVVATRWPMRLSQSGAPQRVGVAARRRVVRRLEPDQGQRWWQRGVRRALRRSSRGAAGQGGGVRFRVWAPRAESSVTLLLDGVEYDMSRVGDGWWQSDDVDAESGSRYAFSLDGGEPRADPRTMRLPDGSRGRGRGLRRRRLRVGGRDVARHPASRRRSCTSSMWAPSRRRERSTRRSGTSTTWSHSASTWSS